MSTDPREIVIRLKATAEAVGFADFKRQLQDAQRQIESVSRAGAGGGQPAGLQGAVNAAVGQAAAAGIDPATAQRLINQTLGTPARAAAPRVARPAPAPAVGGEAGGEEGEPDFEQARARARARSQQRAAQEETRNAQITARFRRLVEAQPEAEAVPPEQDPARQAQIENLRRQQARQAESLLGQMARQEASQAQSNERITARFHGQLAAQGETEGISPEQDPQRQAQLRTLRSAQQRQYDSLIRQFQGNVTGRYNDQDRAEREQARAAQQSVRAAAVDQRAADKRMADAQKVLDQPAEGEEEEGGGGRAGRRGRRAGGAPGAGGGGFGDFAAGLAPSTPEQLVRLVGALTGAQLGLDVMAGAARRLHQALQEAIDTEIQMERASRSLAGTVGGPTASAFGQAANRFVADPTTTGTRTEFLQSIQAAQTLNQVYGLSQQQIEQVATASGRLARIHGVDLVQAEAAVQSALRGETSGLEQFGISLTDSSGRLRGQGQTYQELVTVAGQYSATQTVLSRTLAAVSQQQVDAKIGTDQLAISMDRLARSGQNAQQVLGVLAAGPVTGIATGVANLATPPTQQQLGTPNPLGPGVDAGTGASLVAGAQNRITEATKNATDALSVQSRAVESMISGARSAAVQLTALAEAQGRLAQISNAARGPDFFANSAARQAQAQAQAGADIIARQAGGSAQGQAMAYRRQLETALAAANADTGTSGPTAVASFVARRLIPQQLSELDRRTPARSAQIDAQEAARLGQRGGQDAQARIQTIDLADQQRQLDSAKDIADLRTETLNREGDILNLQRQQADLADTMRVAQRENLDLVIQEAQARQAALQPAARLTEVEFNQRRAQLEIQARRADVRLGIADPSALAEIPALRQQLRISTRQLPRAELNDLLAQRPVQVAEQQVTADQLARTVRVAGITGQQRGIEDQLTPLQQAQRLTDERTAAIQRQLELAVLAETSERTAAQQAKLAADAVVVAADAAARRADEWAASINDGLTDLQRAQGLLAGVATQGITPTTNNVNAQIVINGAGDPAEVARQVLQLLNGGGISTPRAVSITQDLHGH